jgi:hypothetical protein
MFFLFTSLELVKFIYRIQTNKNYFFLLLNKQTLLFVKTEYFCYSFFDLGIELFFLCLDRLLVRYRKYFVFFIIIAGFVLTSILGITSILRIRDSYIIATFAIKINGFLITNTRNYLVSILFDIVS